MHQEGLKKKEDRPGTYDHNIEACYCNHCCCGKTVRLLHILGTRSLSYP